MFRTTLAAGLVALGSLAFTAPSNAAGLSITIGPSAPYGSLELVDHRGGGYGRLSPREVRRILRDEGYRQIQFLDRGGRIYTASAEDWRGREVIVRVSARSGDIISVRRIGRGRGGHGGGYGDGGGHGGGYGDGGGRGDYECWLPEGCSY